VSGGLSQQSVWEALQPYLKEYWKVLEAVKDRAASRGPSAEEKTDTVCTHTYIYLQPN